MRRFAPAVLALALLSGCDELAGDCGACTTELVYAVVVSVSGPGAAPDASLVVVSGPSLPPGEVLDCRPSGAAATCGFGLSAGEYVFDVAAPGYRTREAVRLEVRPALLRDCCDPDYVPAHLDVALEPL